MGLIVESTLGERKSSCGLRVTIERAAFPSNRDPRPVGESRIRTLVQAFQAAKDLTMTVKAKLTDIRNA
jgi:hypothetical protein